MKPSAPIYFKSSHILVKHNFFECAFGLFAHIFLWKSKRLKNITSSLDPSLPVSEIPIELKNSPIWFHFNAFKWKVQKMYIWNTIYFKN